MSEPNEVFGSAAPDDLLDLTATIVAAYVSNNSVQEPNLPTLVESVHAALKKASGVIHGEMEHGRTPPVPAVPIKKSVTPDHIVCLEDGKKFKSLKRHLLASYGMSPEEYREKWGLPADYPMVAPNYAAARSDLAKKMGLGKARENRVSVAA